MATYNLVLVVAMLGAAPLSSGPRAPIAITSSILGIFSTLEECKQHMGLTKGDQSLFHMSDQPLLRETTYCSK